MIDLALNEVVTYRSDHLGIEHLLVALTTAGSPSSVSKHENLFTACSIIRKIVLNNMTIGNGNGTRSVPHTTAAKQSLIFAMERANSLHHAAVNPEHVFLGILELPSNRLLKQLEMSEGIDVDELRLRLLSVAHLDTSTALPPPTEDDK